jgi:hypothetical protein
MFEHLSTTPPPHRKEDPEQDGGSCQPDKDEDTCYCTSIREEAA